MDIPLIKVGIMAEREILFTLTGDYFFGEQSVIVTGLCKAIKTESAIRFEAGTQSWICGDSLKLIPVDPQTATFILPNVTIGLDFHWQRKENQEFKGELSFVSDGDKIHAVNILSIEDYLLSVISSEMSATSSPEFLKAHAVISRSWLLAQVQKNKFLQTGNKNYQTTFYTDDELVRWYDREDHLLFDVCADDHCQRYQGVTRAASPLIEDAVFQSSGEVLVFNGTICDARFSKCCGGVTELFENVWEPVNHPYLQCIADKSEHPQKFIPDLTIEQNAGRWILGNPGANCNTTDKKVLKQVLNDYDQETNDFFRWKVVYSQEELGELVKLRSGIDFGEIVELIPLKRGPSGRLIQLKIVGTLWTMTIGKELEIRKTLSKTHLYSSAFIIEKHEEAGNVKFILHGAGWGHGVGLCQIGAAVMGEKGDSYAEILFHYFPGAKIEKMY